MNVRSRAACISAAVAALACGGGVQARDLTWDYSPGDGVANDGSGIWNLSSTNWVDSAAPGANTTWDNTIPDSAIFGGGVSGVGADPTTPYNVDLASHVIVQNLTLAEVPGNAQYSISSFSGGSLTLNGNLIKSGNDGFLNFFTNTILAAGNHTVTLRDTPNDGIEFIYNGVISGSGGLTLDNDIYEAWGTLGFNQANTYTGVTNINKGRLVLTDAGGLGATAAGSGTNIGSIGTLSLYGAGTVPIGGLNIAEPITITRDTYAGGEFERYRAAIISANGSGTHTFSGPFVVDSIDARVRAESSTIVISSNITAGPTVPNGVLTVDGDFAGFVTLTGNNAGIAAGGIKLVGGVELNVSNHDNLGGPTAPITFAGSGTLHPIAGFMTSFGSHPINNTTFSGGIDVDAGHAFTIDQNLGDAVTAVGAIGKRGLGTLNLNSTINLRGGQTFWDAGVVNVNGSTTLHSLHLRSPVVNIGTGGSVTTTTGFNSIGQDSTGTNGGPDIAVVNITGNGALIQTNAADFNVSDNANTEGTINLKDNGVLTTTGLTFVAKNAGAKGTINQEGGTFTINRTGNFGLVLGSRNGTGTYNLSGGTLNSAGEFYVGQGGAGVGVFNMSGGTVNQNNWFVVGREGGAGTVDFSGGIFNKTGGGSSEVDVSGGVGPSSMTIRNAAEYRAQTGDFRVGINSGSNGTLLVTNFGKVIVTAGEFWVGQGGGSTGVATFQDNASLAVNNNWIAIGRGDGNGTLNILGDATVTKAGGGNVEVDFGGGGQGIVNVKNAAIFDIQGGELRVGQSGGSNGQLNIQDSGAVSVNNWIAIGRGGGTGTLNMSGGSLNKTGGGNAIIAAGGSSNGTFTQTGGTFTNTTSETWINEGGTSGIWNFSGGTANLGRLDVGRNGGGTATLNLSAAAVLNATTVRLGEANTVGGVVNQSGGTFTANDVTIRAGSNRDYNLTGGTLNATSMINESTFDYTGGVANIGTINGNGTTTVGPAVNLTVNQLRQGALVVQGTAKVNPNGGDVGTTIVKSLGVTGKLDLSDNDLLVDYTDPVGTLEEDVRQLVRNGRASGSTSGIFSTPGATADDVVLAVVDNGEWGKTAFGSFTIDASTIVGKYTYFGDSNLDGQVTGDDYLAVDSNLGTGNSWIEGDFNMDTAVTGDDYLAIDTNLGKGTTNPLAFAELKAEMIARHVEMFGEEYLVKLAEVEANGITVVPEPMSISLIGAGACGLLARRRARRR